MTTEICGHSVQEITSGNPVASPTDRLQDAGSLLAVCEQLAPSMNGSAANRLVAALDDLAFGSLHPLDEQWLSDAQALATELGRVEFWTGEVERLHREGIRVLSSLNDGYPANLSLAHNRPPVLFMRGQILASDVRAISVVGTRSASDDSLAVTARLTTALVESGVTIVSGLAKGVDTAAHAAALNAGGRTIAVFGTSIDRVYPAENRNLARAVAQSGACVSQFLPNIPTGPWSFPVRNVVTSGLSLGTVVVEAGETSGAKSQAEAALAHGKRVFLLAPLVHRESWARAFAERPRVSVVTEPGEVISSVEVDTASDLPPLF